MQTTQLPSIDVDTVAALAASGDPIGHRGVGPLL